MSTPLSRPLIRRQSSSRRWRGGPLSEGQRNRSRRSWSFMIARHEARHAARRLAGRPSPRRVERLAARRERAARSLANLLAALESWERTAPALEALSDELERGGVRGEIELDEAELASPLPRTWQWLDGSAFPSHGELMQRAFGQAIVDETRTKPLMYQGGSDDFLGPRQHMPLPSEADGIDFEAEVAVVVDRVPMGTQGRRRARAREARDARERREPALARATGEEDRLRLDPRETGHELQPRRRDPRRARQRLAGRARLPADSGELERAGLRASRRRRHGLRLPRARSRTPPIRAT